MQLVWSWEKLTEELHWKETRNCWISTRDVACHNKATPSVVISIVRCSILHPTRRYSLWWYIHLRWRYLRNQVRRRQIIDGHTYQMEDSRPVPAERLNQVPRYQITWLVVECSESGLISVQCSAEQTSNLSKSFPSHAQHFSGTSHWGEAKGSLLGKEFCKK